MIYVIGHKNPDTDSICSAIGYAALKQQLGMECEPRRAGEINPETKFILNRFGVEEPQFLPSAKDEKIILVDHNEIAQAVDELSEGTVIEIMDHHKIGDVQTKEPIYFRNMPLGCTATIVYLSYKENNIQPEKAVAGLLCSAILSDTLAFRSPTCTATDKAAALALAEIAGIGDCEAYAKEMFAAGSNLAEKSEKEIFYLDFKKFTAGTTTFGVGQVTSMSAEELSVLKGRMIAYLENTFAEHGADMLFFMLTDIMEESTELLYAGNGAEDAVKKAFVSAEENRTYLKGVVSRKKQIVPQLTEALS